MSPAGKKKTGPHAKLVLLKIRMQTARRLHRRLLALFRSLIIEHRGLLRQKANRGGGANGTVRPLPRRPGAGGGPLNPPPLAPRVQGQGDAAGAPPPRKGARRAARRRRP